MLMSYYYHHSKVPYLNYGIIGGKEERDKGMGEGSWVREGYSTNPGRTILYNSWSLRD